MARPFMDSIIREQRYSNSTVMRLLGIIGRALGIDRPRAGT